MQWLTLVLSTIGGALITLIGSLLYFRPKLKEAQAGAKKAETEASDAHVKYLVERIESVEKLYAEQGKNLDSMRGRMTDMRERMTEMEDELRKKDKRIQQLEDENKELTRKVQEFEKDLKTYKSTQLLVSDGTENK